MRVFGFLGHLRVNGALVPVLMCPLWTKMPQQDIAGLSTQERGSTPLSLQKQIAAEGPIVLNFRKQAFMDQTFGSAGAGPPQ